MSALPRLVLASEDPAEIARVIRGALRLRTEVVHLAEPPMSMGQHLLDVEVPGHGIVNLLVEPAGLARPDGVPLRVRPVTRVQMAELFALLERLDQPSETVPPPADDDWDEPDGPDNTVLDAPTNAIKPGMFDDFGVIDSIIPNPPSSVMAPPSSNGRGEADPPSRPKSVIPPDPRIGRVLAGKYQIEAPLGSGAAAIVYRATHADLGRPVAVKILHAENQSEAQFVKRFKAEARTASLLDHQNVTRVIDFGQQGDELYLVMELVTGKTLEAVLTAEGHLPARRVVDMGLQVCRALSFAHERDVIHRDIKPENIMLVPDKDDDGDPCDLVKVCDFGLAKLNSPDSGPDLTVVGMLCGSPAYMSPEQTRGEPLDARSDIYALGVTMFEALTGTLPLEAFSLAELFMKKSTTPPRRPLTIVEGLDPLLDDVVLRTMAVERDKRHSTVRELRAELRAVLDQLDDEPPSHRTIVAG